MNDYDLKYIFSNIHSNRMNIYKRIPTSNTMRQYVDKADELGINYDSGIGLGKQKTLIIKDENDYILGEIKDRIYPKNTKNAVDIASDKFVSEKYLINGGVNTTKSKIYSVEDIEQAKNDFFSNGNSKYAVIKPTNMSQGIGVNVKVDKTTFEFYWKDTANSIGNRKSEILVQEYFEGFEARAVVLLGKLISVVARVPAYVKGNGKDKIRDLIKFKNINRKKCANLRHRLIQPNEKMEKFLNANGRTLDSIPSQNEYVLLSSLSNISLGGEMVDITEYISDEIGEIAVESIASIPGLYSGGVDIMLKDFKDTNPAVIEINAWPMLQSTIYPTYGRAYDPQKYFLKAFYSLCELEKNKEIKRNNLKYINSFLEFQDLKIKLLESQINNT